MYLSKLVLDRRKASNPYQIHRLLWRAFPGMPDENRPFLFRVNWGQAGSPLQILMQSRIQPAQPDESSCRLLAQKPVELNLRKGQVLRFALCANPIKFLKEERCRVPLIDDQQILDWLKRKLDSAVETLDAQLEGRKNLFFRRNGQAGKIVTVNLSGVLRVRDNEGLLRLIERGIGPAKSFGCGLMLLRRV
ncbi:MAG: type I-E CRISPR-associated protein Cas6/Cse3/CasE, partial [Nitrospinales bacterium]